MHILASQEVGGVPKSPDSDLRARGKEQWEGPALGAQEEAPTVAGCCGGRRRGFWVGGRSPSRKQDLWEAGWTGVGLGLGLVPQCRHLDPAGVDDVFVFINTYRQAAHLEDPQLRMIHTIQTAGQATFFTSLTTAAAYAANVFSQVGTPPLPSLHARALPAPWLVCWVRSVLRPRPPSVWSELGGLVPSIPRRCACSMDESCFPGATALGVGSVWACPGHRHHLDGNLSSRPGLTLPPAAAPAPGTTGHCLPLCRHHARAGQGLGARGLGSCSWGSRFSVSRQIPAVHDFGLFMSLIVSCCWLAVLFTMPAALGIWSLYLAPLESACQNRWAGRMTEQCPLSI